MQADAIVVNIPKKLLTTTEDKRWIAAHTNITDFFYVKKNN